jgi:molybdopterin converting factor small subunit
LPKVLIADSNCRAMTGGLAELDVDAASVRALIAAIDARFPGAGEYIDRRMAVAVDGEIYQDPGPLALTPSSEVCLIPRIGGG